MSLKDCIGKKAEEGKVRKDDADLAQQIYGQEMEAHGDAALASAKTVEYLKHIKAKKKAQAFLKAQTYDRLHKAMEGKSAKEMAETAFSTVESLGKQGDAGPSVHAVSKGIRAEAHSKLAKFLYHHRRNLLGKTGDKAGSHAVAREAFGQSTGNDFAKAFNEAWQEVAEYLRVRFNAAGGDIGKHERWGLPTRWDSARMEMQGEAAFIEDAMNRLDWDRMAKRLGRSFPEKARVKALKEVYASITTKGWNKKEATAGGGAKSLANQKAEARFMEWNTGDDWLFMQGKYGSGDDVLSIMNAHIDAMARDTAAIEVLGPNPNASIKLMQNIMAKEANVNKSLTKSERGTLKKGASFLPGLYDTYTGSANIPASELLAKNASDLRAILTGAQLGGAFLSALSDTWFSRMAAKFNGVPQLKVLQRHLQLFANPNKEDMLIAVRSGLIADSWSQVNAAAMRYTGEIPTSEYARVLSDGVIRASGLGHWTQAGRWAFGLEFMGMLADNSGKSFDALPAPVQRAMTRYDISSGEWDAIRATPLMDHKGAKFLALGDIKFQAVRKKAMNMVHTETEFAVPSTSLRGRATFKGGKPGTWPGELLNSSLMYKNFAITMYHTHLRRAMAQPDGLSKTAYLGSLVLGTTMMGSLSLQLKDIARGKDIQPMGNMKFLLAAMIQGGGLGIFGDFMFSNWTRFGHSPAEAIAGPGVAWAADTLRLGQSAVMSAYNMENKIGGDLVRYVGRYTPGSSLWYTRLMFERGVLDQIQTLVDPKYKKRWQTQEQNMMKEKGQEFWLPRGQIVPDRAPVVGAF